MSAGDAICVIGVIQVGDLEGRPSCRPKIWDGTAPVPPNRSFFVPKGLGLRERYREPSAETLGYCQGPARDRRSRLQLDPRALEERAEDFFGFEELAGDFA